MRRDDAPVRRPRPDPDVLPILYRDEYLVAIHKPAGVLVHRTPIDAHDRRAVVQVLRGQMGRRVYPVHRLDKGASGALLIWRPRPCVI